MRIAIVGGGVSGLVAAHHLHARHEITLFEAGPRLGGHSNTVTVERDGSSFSIDTGFIVLNDRNYPQFRAILAAAGVPLQPTHMGFSVHGEDEDFEFAGTPSGVFCQRANLARPAFWRMLADLRRFNRELRALLGAGAHDERSLAQFVSEGGYSRWFIERLIVPQASAVWSADPAAMWSFPVSFLAEFFANHGMLGFRERPRWQTVVGGSQRYVQAISAPFADRVLLGHPVVALWRDPDGVRLRAGGEDHRFDEVVIACHADQALELLQDATPAERELLAAFRYQHNEAVLHTDETLLPRRRAARQAWNYHLFAQPRPLSTVTYYMNHLQRLRQAPEHFCVSLNMGERIDPAKVIASFDYAHPVFTATAVAAQGRWAEISGAAGRTRYCGAYWGFGFHEDGVSSATRAVKGL